MDQLRKRCLILSPRQESKERLEEAEVREMSWGKQKQDKTHLYLISIRLNEPIKINTRLCVLRTFKKGYLQDKTCHFLISPSVLKNVSSMGREGCCH